MFVHDTGGSPLLTARGALACSTRGKKQSEVQGAGNAIAVACSSWNDPAGLALEQLAGEQDAKCIRFLTDV